MPTLSKVESDRLSLSYDKLIRLSEGLGIDISQLFASAGAHSAGPCRILGVCSASEGQLREVAESSPPHEARARPSPPKSRKPAKHR